MKEYSVTGRLDFLFLEVFEFGAGGAGFARFFGFGALQFAFFLVPAVLVDDGFDAGHHDVAIGELQDVFGFRLWDREATSIFDLSGWYIDTSEAGGAFSSEVDFARIMIDGANRAPSGSSGKAAITEDAEYALSVTDFGFHDLDGDVFKAVKITELPDRGTLLNNGSAVTAGESVSLGDITARKLVFRPSRDANGLNYTTFMFQVQDSGSTSDGGVDLDPVARVFSFDVSSVNDAPTAIKGSNQTVLEDAGAQSVANWATGISTGPADEAGQALTFNVTGNSNPGLFSVAPAIATDGTLTYTPAANANGFADITINLSDDGGTANGGADSSGSVTFRINVTAVNDAPSGTSTRIVTRLKRYVLTIADFGFSDSSDTPPNSFQALIITAVSSGGRLFNNKKPSPDGARVLAFDISTGKLVLKFPKRQLDQTVSVMFRVEDNGGTVNSGTKMDLVPRTITFARR